MGETTVFSSLGEEIREASPFPFANEDELQVLIANHPDLVASATGRSLGSVRLVRREAGIPTAEGGPDDFSTDHLFVDADSVPIIVEVKRAADTRIRREVVGQVLDYAANAAEYWDADRLARWISKSDSDEDEIGTIDSVDLAAEMHANLAAGRIRLLFVADQIPNRLRSVIEFLSRQFETVEVSGAQVHRYGHGDSTVLTVDRVGALLPTIQGRQNTETLAQAMASSSSEFKRLVELVNEWAAGRFEVVEKSKSIRVLADDFGAVLYLYPTYDYFELRLKRLGAELGQEVAGWISERVGELPGGKATTAFCTVSATEAVQHWDSDTVDALDEIMRTVATGTPLGMSS